MRTSNGREAILRAARDTFASKGFDGASIRDIAQEAGLSLSALYYYFPSKQDALFELVSTSYRWFNASSRRTLQTAQGDLPLQVALYVRHLVQFRVFNPQISRVVLRDSERLTPDLFASLHELQRESRALFTDIVREGQAAGEFDVGDAVLSSRSVLSICNSIPLWYVPGGDITPQQLERTYTIHAMRIVGCHDDANERYFAAPVPTGDDAVFVPGDPLDPGASPDHSAH